MRRNQGSTLIVTMVVLAGLAAALAALSASENIAAKEEINRSEHAQAKQAYMDGIQNALSVLSQIVEPGGQTSSANSLTSTNLSSTSNNSNTTGVTMLSDDWAEEGSNGDVLYHVGNHTFRMQIIDGCSLLNINCTTSTGTTASINAGCNSANATVGNNSAQPIGASDAVLNNLPFQPQEIECIEDYRSSSTTQQALGAKDAYYQALKTPYNAKLLPFETFDELLQVEGLTAKLLYFPRTDVTTPTNPLVDANGNPQALSDVLTAYSVAPLTTPTGGAKVNMGGNAAINPGQLTGISQGVRTLIANTSQSGGVRPTGGWVSLGQIIRTVGNRASMTDLGGILNMCKLSTATTINGLVNINTAPASVLEQLPGITPTIAAAIVNQQSTGFLHVGDITTVGGITPAILAQFADQITATSQTFIVRVIGTAGSTSIPVQAVVSVTNDTPQIISIQEMPFSAKEMMTRWTWDDNTTTDTTLKDNS